MHKGVKEKPQNVDVGNRGKGPPASGGHGLLPSKDAGEVDWDTPDGDSPATGEQTQLRPAAGQKVSSWRDHF